MTNTTIETMEPGECRVQAALYVVLVFGLSLILYLPIFLSGIPVAKRPLLAATLQYCGRRCWEVFWVFLWWLAKSWGGAPSWLPVLSAAASTGQS